MTEYLEFDIELLISQEGEQETVLALLADFGFHGFREEEERIFAYILRDRFSSKEFEFFLDDSGQRSKIKSYKSQTIKEENWNKLWEENYSPVQVLDNCYIRAPFHLPPKGVEFDLIISPKMSFGTAHHESTRLMLETILDGSWEKERVLDFGSGTGILAILAEKMGSIEIVALDYDHWAWENARENLTLNNCRNIKVVKGEISLLKEDSFQTIFANINLNILIQEMSNIGKCLSDRGVAIMSGFYKENLETLEKAASESGLTLITKKTLNNWMVGVFRKGD